VQTKINKGKRMELNMTRERKKKWESIKKCVKTGRLWMNERQRTTATEHGGIAGWQI